MKTVGAGARAWGMGDSRVMMGLRVKNGWMVGV